MRFPPTVPVGPVPLARLHAAAATLFLAGGTLWVSYQGFDAFHLRDALPLLVLGGLTLLVVGSSRMLVAGLLRRSFPGPPWLPLAPSLLIASGAMVAFLSPLPSAAAAAGALLWAVGLLTHVAFTVGALRRPGATPTPRTARPPAPEIVPALGAGAFAYAVAAALLLPMSYSGAIPLMSVLHLFLAGFVTLAILAVLTRLLPAFADAAPSTLLSRVALLPALLGPALLALGVDGPPRMLRAGAVLEALGLGLLALALLLALARSPRPRLSHAAYGVALLFLVAGVGVGASFAYDPDLKVLVPLHALLNLFGFVGLTIHGAILDLYAPAPRAGRTSLHAWSRATLALAVFGLFAAVATLGPWPDLARVGLALFGLSFLLVSVGLVASHRRSEAALHRRAPGPAVPASQGGPPS